MNNTPIILCLSSSTLSFLFFASSLWGRFLISRFWDVHCALCKQGRHRQKVSYVTCMFVFDDRQKSYHDGPKSWFHIQLLIGISLDRQMRDRRKSMCKSPIGVCLIGECLGTIFFHAMYLLNREIHATSMCLVAELYIILIPISLCSLRCLKKPYQDTT